MKDWDYLWILVPNVTEPLDDIDYLLLLPPLKKQVILM